MSAFGGKNMSERERRPDPPGADRPARSPAAAARGLARRTALAAPALLLVGGGAFAQTWPDRPVRIIVAFPAGSGTDIMARLLADPLAREIGQPVVIENRPGGNGVVGTQAAALAPADGYTLLVISTSAASINPHVLRRLPYDAVRDFAPIGGLAEGPYVLATRPDHPARDLRGFIEHARARPGEVTYSHGNASALIMSSMFARMAGLQLAGVSYRGGAEAVADVAAGRIDFTFADFSVGMAQARTGRVRALGHSLDRTFAAAPDLPPVAAAVAGFDVNVWWGLAAPAGTPAAVVNRANAALNATLNGEAVGARLHQLGYQPMPMTPSAFADYMQRQVAIWGERVRLAGIEPQ